MHPSNMCSDISGPKVYLKNIDRYRQTDIDRYPDSIWDFPGPPKFQKYSEVSRYIRVQCFNASRAFKFFYSIYVSVSSCQVLVLDCQVHLALIPCIEIGSLGLATLCSLFKFCCTGVSNISLGFLI